MQGFRVPGFSFRYRTPSLGLYPRLTWDISMWPFGGHFCLPACCDFGGGQQEGGHSVWDIEILPAFRAINPQAGNRWSFHKYAGLQQRPADHDLPYGDVEKGHPFVTYVLKYVTRRTDPKPSKKRSFDKSQKKVPAPQPCKPQFL